MPSLSPGGRQRLRQAILCVLAVLLAGYWGYWFYFALDMQRMEAVAVWGQKHGINWQLNSRGGVWAAPGTLWHSENLP